MSAEQSILRRLDPSGGLASRVVLLREEAEAATPMLSPRPSAEGRYQIVGEIARGGVGVVMKGHDVDLGRDVALKFLRDEHASNPDVLQRFVEEAQIGGQLQHPGIVPVYEIGLRKDDRPFFTMKLVKGRTLAALLADRPDVATDLPRLISIFESVCQTMAYAHSRGVIHRDLKPGNVMVGAFGEVLVVDWGMGKVLGRPSAAPAAPPLSVIATVRSGSSSAPSELGSILGTPAYMAPEQARGEVDRLDARADVFSLGALLCEILTGRPPYATHAEAARCDLGDALARLDACGGDPELAALARACLAPAADARPRDAGAVAAEVARHAAGRDRRAREAQLDAAEAEARVDGERRRHRLVLALAAALIALVAAGGFLWLRSDVERRDREEAAALAASAAIDEAALLQGRERWGEAVSAAKRAVALAAEADPATAARAALCLDGVGRLAREALERAEAAERDRRLLDELDRVRDTEWDKRDYPKKDALYVAAFRAWGADFETMTPERIAALLHARPIALEAALELDYWVNVAGPERLRQIAEVADRLDADPWRMRLRRATSRDELLRLADEAAGARVESLVSLATRLMDFDEYARSVALLRSSWMEAPGNYRLNRMLGVETRQQGAVGNPEALLFATAAVALRPDSSYAHDLLATALGRGKRSAEALAHYRRALEIEDDDQARHGLALTLKALGRPAEALAEAEAAVRAFPESAVSAQSLSSTRLHVGDVPRAIEAGRRAVQLDPDDAMAHTTLANALCESGAPEDALPHARRAAELSPKQTFGHESLARVLLELGHTAEAEAAARETIRLDPFNGRARDILALLLVERGDAPGLMEQARAMLRIDPDEPTAHVHIATAWRLRGESETALASLRRATALGGDSAAIRVNVAAELWKLGRFGEAAAEYRAAFDLAAKAGGHRRIRAETLASYESAAASEQRLERYLRAEFRPASLEEQMDLAGMAVAKRLYDVARDLCLGALDFAPGAVCRHQAAYCSILLGSGLGPGEGLDWETRASERRKAIAWIHADLDRRGTLQEVHLRGFRDGLAEWKRDPNLAAIRDDLAALPRDEVLAWERIWERIDAFVAEGQ